MSKDGDDWLGGTSKPMLERATAAEFVYKQLKDSERATFELAAGYGRWLIASLLVIHGGGLVGVFGLFKEAAGNQLFAHAAAATATWLVAGVLLALLCGLATWLNWSFHAASYANRANVEMLWNPSVWENPPTHTRRINFTYWISLVCGVLSGCCVLGALWVLQGAV